MGKMSVVLTEIVPFLAVIVVTPCNIHNIYSKFENSGVIWWPIQKSQGLRPKKMKIDNSVQELTIITTGGTIEKTYDEIEGSLHNRETIIKNRIENGLRLPYTRIQVRALMAKDSLDMDMNDRLLILEAVKSHASEGNPIVILHGTDTMQQTAEVIEKEFQDINVAVVLTGAMKPLGFIDSDAVQNVVEAMMVAKILDPGVYISFHNRLFKVPGVRKNKQLRTFETF
jgi:L-asparaginase